jgi:hypothetical protein
MNYKDIEYVVRARPGRDQWTFVISYPRSVSMPLIASLARMGSLATALVMHARSSQKAPAPWMLRPLGATWPRSTTGRLSELTGSAKARILKFRPAGQSRRVSFSHWQLNPRLSRAFFAALSDCTPLRHGVAFAVYIVITLQNAVQTSPMHTDRMGTRRRRDLQRQRPAVLLFSRPFCHKKHPD